MSDTKFVVYVLMLIFAVLVADQAIGSDEPPNNEPYTGLCVRPSTQGGC